MDSPLLIMLFVGIFVVLGTVVHGLISALAFKLYTGHRSIPFGWGEFAWRSLLVGMGMVVISGASYGIVRALTLVNMGDALSIVTANIVLFPVAVTLVWWCYGLDEATDAAMVALLIYGIPWFLLFLCIGVLMLFGVAVRRILP